MESKYKTIHENKNDLEQFYKPSSNPNDAISNLERYSLQTNSAECICWCEMEKDLEGDYVLFSDVLKAVSFIFRAK